MDGVGTWFLRNSEMSVNFEVVCSRGVLFSFLLPLPCECLVMIVPTCFCLVEKETRTKVAATEHCSTSKSSRAVRPKSRVLQPTEAAGAQPLPLVIGVT